MNFMRYKAVLGIIISLMFFFSGGSLFSQNETLYPTGTVIPPEVVEYWKTHQPSPVLAKPQSTLATTKNWSWRDSSVKNQGSCGACWAFAAVAIVENLGTQNDLSEQALLNCLDGNDCNGGWYGYALVEIRDQGVPPEACAHYIASKQSCDNVCQSPPFLEKVRNINSSNGYALWGAPDGNTIAGLKYRLQGGPLVVFMLVPEDGTFDTYTGGLYDYDGGTIPASRGHAVLLVGYNDDEQSFTVKNSWGTGWGEGGYFRISYDDVQDDVQFGGYAMTASQAYTEITTPVELGVFEVFTYKNTVTVEWATLSESNNYGFEIQRSQNGIGFEPLAFIPGFGTTNVPRQYQYADAGLAVGNYHYRLKQLDFDGSFMLTDVLTVD
ncbi:hypothetical protein KAH55_12460, partial [bacterium]|nr:hypothetical protein [bacterium]